MHDDDLRHLFVAATFFAENENGEFCGDKNADPESLHHPVTGSPLHWLYGKSWCEKIGLPPGEWHEPEWDPMIEYWTYEVKEAAWNITEEVWQEFAKQYSYIPEYSEANMGMYDFFPDYGLTHRPGFRWDDSGMDWNSGGWTPVLNVSVSLTAKYDEVKADPEHFGFEVKETP